MDPATNTLVNLRAYQSWSKDLSTTTRTYKTEHVEEISIRGVTCQLVNNAWLRCQASGADTANKAQVITYFEHHTEGEKGKETSSGFDFVSLDSTDSTVKPALSVSFQK
ncbi:MAG: hypothetical protein NTV52_04240 [Acidobacteria bacterium]|nr:hypothetical protein [Acidobacteriota bacterium]